jgi:hypothetical protein
LLPCRASSGLPLEIAEDYRDYRLGERVSMRRVEYRDIAVAALTIVLVSTLLLAFVF